MSKDKMPTEVTSTVVGWRGLAVAVLAFAGVGAESILVDGGQPWWYVPAAVVAGAVIWWAVYALLVTWEETERDDGEQDAGSRIARTLRRAWTRQKISQVEPEPDEGEETEK
jgi:hypothetical protein